MMRNGDSKIKNKIKNRNGQAWIALLAVILLFSAVLSGCGGTTGQEQPGGQTLESTTVSTAQNVSSAQTAAEENVSSAQAPAEESAAADKFPLKVTDAGGFEMTIASEPKRIISLTLGSDEMLLGFVDKSRILAITSYADDAGISNVSADAAGVPERVSSDKLEKIIELKPDLLVLDTWADPKFVKQMRDAGITVYTFKTPSNVDEQKTVIAELAKITGAEEKGTEIINWMDAKLNEVSNRLAALKPEEKLTVMDYGEMGSSGKGTNYDDIVTRAGLINVVSKAGMEGWPVVSKEKMIEMNPDIITLPSWYYDRNNSLQGMTDKLKKDKSLQTVNAIKENRLISVPNPHISAISQYVVLGVEDVAKAAYPELFK